MTDAPSPASRDEWSVTRAAPLGARCFDGHFPGNPLAPGAYLLALAADALSDRGLGIASIRRVKFVGPVKPDDQIEIRVREQTPGRAGPAVLRWFAPCGLAAEARAELRTLDG